MSEQGYAVSTESLRELSRRVGEASAAVAALRAEPGALAGSLARAGSSPLVAAADGFARSWADGCAALEHQTSLLSDALRRAGDLYEVHEADALMMLRAARSAGYLEGLDGL